MSANYNAALEACAAEIDRLEAENAALREEVERQDAIGVSKTAAAEAAIDAVYQDRSRTLDDIEDSLEELKHQCDNYITVIMAGETGDESPEDGPT
ncbi:MAG: hypothetical protein AAGL98_12050 [Planctomycetota bacterium]